MREILFRGQIKDHNEWVEGSLILTTSVQQKPYIVDSCWCEYGKINDEGFADFNWLNAYEVIPETIGQYTGLNVGNEKLFEGDIVEWHEDYDDTWGYSHTTVGRSVVIWDKENFCWAFKTDTEYIQSFNDWNWDNSYIIGNIHDNPELLKEREQ